MTLTFVLVYGRLDMTNTRRDTAKYPREFHRKYSNTTAYLTVYVNVTEMFKLQVMNGGYPTFSNGLLVYEHSTA